MNEHSHFDVIVAGSGPAGASAAHSLASAGLRTLVLDKARLPRYKTCGGGITWKAVRALPFSIDPVVERTLHKIEFTWRTTSPTLLESPEPLVAMVQRSRFDQYLAEQAVSAGAQLLDETPVTSTETEENGNFTVRTPRGAFTASYLVGADGATGRVARSLNLMHDRYALAALESEVEVEAAVMHRWSDRAGLDLGELRATYGWVFPKGDHLSVGVGGIPLLDDYGSHLKLYEEKHAAARVPHIKRVIRRHGYLLPCRRADAPVQSGRALLVGDAAGLVEAFTGEGIYWAIRSGQIAAEAIAEGRELPDYQRRLDAALMPDLLSARRWMQVYIRAPRACYTLPRRVPAFWRAVCKIVRGDRRFSDVRSMLGPLGVVEKALRDPLPAAR